MENKDYFKDDLLKGLGVVICMLRAIAQNMGIDTAKELTALFEEWDREDDGYDD